MRRKFLAAGALGSLALAGGWLWAADPVPTIHGEFKLTLPQRPDSELRGNPVARSAAEWKFLRQNNDFAAYGDRQAHRDNLEWLDTKVNWSKQMLVVIDGGYHTTVARIEAKPLVRDGNKLLVPYVVHETRAQALSHPVMVLLMDRFDGEVVVGGYLRRKGDGLGIVIQPVEPEIDPSNNRRN